jgi:hypothetical protein
MSDLTQTDPTRAAAPVALGEALRALPQLAPPADAWAEMAARLAREPIYASGATNARRLHRAYWPIGIAAALVLAVSATALFRLHPMPDSIGATKTQTAATETPAGASSVHNVANSTNPQDASPTARTQLATLQARSRALEQWLRDTRRASTPQSAQDLAASAEIEDMIGFVDVQLGAADPADANATLPLWQRRVSLLEDLSTLRYSANLMNFRDGLATTGNGAAAGWKN